jgi:hypothetical protein
MRFCKFAFYILMVAIIHGMTGCSKPDSPDPIVSLKSSFQFKANGVFYEWNSDYQATGFGSVIIKDNYNPVYLLSASPLNGGGIGGKYLILKINANSLTQNTYALTTTDPVSPAGLANHACSLFDNSNAFLSYQTGDFATVVISNIHDEYYDGTFTALLTKDDSSFQKMNITNGEFKNVKILQ